MYNSVQLEYRGVYGRMYNMLQIKDETFGETRLKLSSKSVAFHRCIDFHFTNIEPTILSLYNIIHQWRRPGAEFGGTEIFFADQNF